MYLLDGKVCNFIDARYKYEGLKVSGVVLRFTQAIPVGAPIPPIGEFILKTWDTFGVTIANTETVLDTVRLRAFNELGIKSQP
ncbi:MAG: hypothetical protein HWQ38_09745 [Nostoc sp. NMS7]|uniref:hypothetical protein n=1 Tax=Nostoc sp. NMS7 TaxID=2815391 RepID=UPI0025FC365F|nr:hypothetical protein [Nostoc sp. NMS7]MBN3946752.1 hypothetical protein [Nostoc sp. NMS7]